MACGLSYGELLLLCTLVPFDWVVHGVRVLPQTLGAKLLVAESEEKNVDLIQLKVTCPEGNFSSSQQVHMETTLFEVDNNSSNSDDCKAKCLCNVRCRSFEYWNDDYLCGLYSGNMATESENLVTVTNNMALFTRDQLSGTEDFTGPKVSWGIPGNNLEIIDGVENASTCAEECRVGEGCLGFEFFTSGVHSGRCQLSSSNDNPSYMSQHPELWYYERRQVLADFMGPFVGTGILLDSLHFEDSNESTASACADRCRACPFCSSFSFKEHWNLPVKPCKITVLDRRRAESAYKTEVYWDYYEKPLQLIQEDVTDFVKESNKMRPDNGFLSQDGRSADQCASLCRDNIFCKSFSVEKLNPQKCKLHASNRAILGASADAVIWADASWDYFECNGCRSCGL